MLICPLRELLDRNRERFPAALSVERYKLFSESDYVLQRYLHWFNYLDTYFPDAKINYACSNEQYSLLDKRNEFLDIL